MLFKVGEKFFEVLDGDASARATPGETGEILISDASIHQLIEPALAVFTVNSGVGSEALLHLKPVYLFGRADYRHVCHEIHRYEQQLADVRSVTDFRHARVTLDAEGVVTGQTVFVDGGLTLYPSFATPWSSE